MKDRRLISSSSEELVAVAGVMYTSALYDEQRLMFE